MTMGQKDESLLLASGLKFSAKKIICFIQIYQIKYDLTMITAMPF